MELVKQDGNDSLDMLIRRAVGKDPFLSFPRPENSPVQLFQLLHTLERPGICLIFSHLIGFVVITELNTSLALELSGLGLRRGYIALVLTLEGFIILAY